MRLSSNRHVLALFRTAMKLGQKELAEIAECSKGLIQGIELGTHKMSEEIASRIMWETNIDLAWLLRNDLNAPMVDIFRQPYTRDTFELARAELLSPAVL